MDDQRMQAYVNLIEQLLGFPKEQERDLLQANVELLDAGLLKVMEQYVRRMESHENDNTVEWLREFAKQLEQALDVVTAETAARFLLETLRLVSDSDGNSQQVYQFWMAQEEQLNVHLLRALPEIVDELFQRIPKQQYFTSSVLIEFGNLICQFPRGKLWLNREIAITTYELVLQVIIHKDFPEQWANIQNNLALALSDCIQGDLNDNLERAIAIYKLALEVRTYEAFPEEWATTQNNLANAFVKRIQGNPNDNLEQAISIYKSILKVRTREYCPEKWAMTRNGLASAYSSLNRGNRTNNLKIAISIYEEILEFYTRDAFREQWAAIHYNLANTISKLIQNDSNDYLRRAVASYQSSLQVYTPFSERWAAVHSGLAITFSKCIQSADNLKHAIHSYQLALKVHTYDAFPNDCRRTARNLGNLYFDQKNWPQASINYQLALKATENLYQSCILLSSKDAELRETKNLRHFTAYTLARTGQLDLAMETLEQGRARGLTESLDRDRADFKQLKQLKPNLYEQYRAITEQLRALENQQRDQMSSTDRNSSIPEALRKIATNLHQQLNNLIQKIRQVPDYKSFLTLPTFEDVRKAVKHDRPLVYLVNTTAGSLALLVTTESIHSIWLDDLTGEFLQKLLIGSGDASNPEGWLGYSQTYSDSKVWLDAIDTTTRQLWEPLMQPLLTHLKTQNYSQAILIPTGLLSLLPLHAAWTEDPTKPTGRRYALDDIHFTYAPNAKSLTAAQSIAQTIQPTTILAIDNPTQNLPNSEREINAAIDSFPDPIVLRHTEATVENVRSKLTEASIVHFACHGKADLNEPLNSGLLMSDGLLTLRDILALNLAEKGGIRLAILSACETGLSGIENIDEAISLPTGLLQAGVAGVIASLWSVSDLSTMLLLTKFYDFWREQHLPPDQALRQAQLWLRDSTNDDIVQDLELALPEFTTRQFPEATARFLHDHFSYKTPTDRPFAHPFHWSAFSYNGV